jgi:hypothetical protein
MRRVSLVLMVLGGVILAAMMCFQFLGDREGDLSLPIGILMFVLAIGFVMFLIFGFTPPVETQEDEEDENGEEESAESPPE